MAKQRKAVHKVQMTDGKRDIIQKLFQEYNIENANDIQEALKDLLGGTIKETSSPRSLDSSASSSAARLDYFIQRDLPAKEPVPAVFVHRQL